MNYQEFLSHIYQKYSGNVKLELNRMRAVLEEMDHPEAALCGFHIAGTNGKGSTCACLEALALAHGHSTGLNTSPHLLDYTERFRINGRDIDFNSILALFHQYEPIFEKHDASFFEITTALAFQLFREQFRHSRPQPGIHTLPPKNHSRHSRPRSGIQAINTVIIEVGLGGRLDATNLFTPIVSAITSIGLDHVKTLGPTLEIIASEKAGIIKTGIPCVLGRIEASPREVILSIASERKAPVYQIDRDFIIQPREMSLSGNVFDYQFGQYSFNALKTNLLGSHQIDNTAVALTSFILYTEALGIPLDEALVRQALMSVHWKGRMQIVQTDPIVILDGAHNVQGVKVLVSNIQSLMPRNRIHFVVSILADKNYAEMLSLICSIADEIYISQNESDRAATIEQQIAEVKQHTARYQSAPSVKEAFQLALSQADKDDIILGGGSLYTVSEILELYKP